MHSSDILSYETYNWKKQASAVLRDSEAEVAFFKMASRIIEDKAAPIYKQPYYLGFELVYASNNFSKIVGIFGFRVGKNILYVPVFYKDGTIKCTDLLYSQNEKLFTPLNPDWCDYMISKFELSIGEGITNDEANKYKQEIDMRWLAYPPTMSKAASAENSKYLPEEKEYDKISKSFIKEFGFDCDGSKSFKEDLDQAFTSFTSKFASEGKQQQASCLQRFIKKAGYDAFFKIAKAVKQDFNFASNVVALLEDDEWMIDEVISKGPTTAIKTAAVSAKSKEEKDKVVNKLLVHKGRFNKNTKLAAEQLTVGFTIEDTRDESEFKPVAVEDNEEWGAINQTKPGVYEVMGVDGDIRKVVAIIGNSDEGKIPAVLLDTKDNSVIIFNDTRDLNTRGVTDPHGQPVNKLWQALAKELVDEDYNDYLVKEMEPGKVYGIYYPRDPQYISDECFYIESKEDRNGVTVYKAIPFHGYNEVWCNKNATEGLTIRVNPNTPRPDDNLKIFNDEVRFIPIPVEDKQEKTKRSPNNINLKVKNSDFIIGNADCVYAASPDKEDDSILTRGEIDIVNPHSSNAKYKIKIKDSGKDLEESNKIASYHFNELEAKVKLMHDLYISQSDAEYLLKQAKEKRNVKFAHQKVAANWTLRPEPDFYDSYDSDLALPMMENQTKVVQSDVVSADMPMSRYGDALQPKGPSNENTPEAASGTYQEGNKEDNQYLLTATPNMLAELAKQTGNKAIFEHGIIGTYAKTYDASAYITEFIPDLRQGLDKLGRLVFLSVWKPEEFLGLYGADDIIELENMLLSSFKQLGDTVLELLLKTKSTQVNMSTPEV